MTGNKKDKNRKKKSWRAKNLKPCCWYCEGNWYARHIEKTRARKKDIKNERHSVCMVGFDL